MENRGHTLTSPFVTAVSSFDYIEDEESKKKRRIQELTQEVRYWYPYYLRSARDAVAMNVSFLFLILILGFFVYVICKVMGIPSWPGLLVYTVSTLPYTLIFLLSYLPKSLTRYFRYKRKLREYEEELNQTLVYSNEKN